MSFDVKKVLSRLLVFFIGLPLVFAIVYFFPQRNHLLANAVITLLCGMAAFEIASFFNVKNILINKAFAVFLSVLIPLGALLSTGHFIPDPPFDVTLALIFAGVIIVLVKTLWHPVENIAALLSLAAAEMAVLLYPGLLLSAVIFLGAYDAPVILFFLSVVLASDSFAWFFGILFGKGNRGIVKVSPNKSIAGFAGGLFSAVLAGLFFQRAIPFQEAGTGVIIAFFTAAAAALGDLAESALKRSAGLKDSGHLFPGRGGILDSLDSIALAAPVFYFLYSLFAA
jgi:phosphatidate cytidylyltransferase